MRSSRRFDPTPRLPRADAARRNVVARAALAQGISWRLAALLLALGACSGIKDQNPPRSVADGGSDTNSYVDAMHWTADVAPACGDGHRDPGELCDDANTKDHDGCTADCKTVEPNFSCPNDGAPCIYQVKCGDGILGPGEQCDPPNVGNGCSAICRLEQGYLCDPPGTPPTPAQPSHCRKTVCGDGNREGTEACDDANTTDGDGCSSACFFEPACGTGACTPKCGDGVKLAPEECDDGNTIDGDGCSGTCAVEMGYSCTDTTSNPLPRLNLAVTYRDFISFPVGTAMRHPDFETFAGMSITPLLVKPMLDAQGVPVMDGRCTQVGITTACPNDQQLTSQANFDQWYRDTAGANIAVKGTLQLPRMANGAYVYDSAGAGFYPIDGKGWVAGAGAKEMTADADAVVNDGKPHNFGFTTEVRYFFQYRGGESLSFSGDDDVWIFINHALALDLGGLHTRTERTLMLDQGAAGLGLKVGGLYEIALFHAERHSAGSNFKLTLTGFAPTSSVCRSACGDGKLAANEQCDDGNMVSGDGCSIDCRYEIVIM